jgi:hypothetical protein
MEQRIKVSSKHLTPQMLKDLLASEVSQEADIRLEIKRFRSLDAGVLVAFFGSIGVGLEALVAGIFKVAGQKGSATIVIQGRSGRRIEVPANTPPDKIKEYVELAKQLDIERIEF